MDKNLLRADIESGLSIRGIAAKQGCSFTNVRHWIRRHGLGKMIAARKWRLNEEVFRQAVAKSESAAMVLRAVGRAVTGSGYQLVSREIRRLGLDISHWTGQAHGRTQQKKIPWSDLLVEGSSKKISYGMKRRLVKDGLLRNECYVCGIGPSWKGKPLVLVLDHINGIRNDHSITNLRLVCPNCDSQLPTFCGRNLKLLAGLLSRNGSASPL